MYKKNAAVICVDDSGTPAQDFELIEGKVYIVHDVKFKPSMFSKPIMYLVFAGPNGKLVEINAKRFKMIDDN